jgi:ATP-dependent DNA helicase RecG
VLTELEGKVLNEIKNNLKISREQIAERLRIKPGTVKEYIKKLRDKGVLRRVGKTSGGYWEILK